MEIEYDLAKDRLNIVLRGMSFQIVAGFDFDGALIRRDDRKEYGEDRFQAIGWIGTVLVFIVFTMRGRKLRVISLRRANKMERKAYEQSPEEGPG